MWAEWHHSPHLIQALLTASEVALAPLLQPPVPCNDVEAAKLGNLKAIIRYLLLV